MALWCDKYRPNSLNKLDYHKEQADHLKKLVGTIDFPHLLFCGPSGAGKKTRIQCLLKELFGVSSERLRIEHQMVTTPSNKKLEIKTVASNYHIEINPSDHGVHDRVVIQEMIKHHAQSTSLSSKHPFKVVIITEADRLTKDAQHALRRTMEKYIKTCRIILCCNSSSRMIPAIQSRCLLIRVAAPSVEVIAKILMTTSKKESFDLKPDLAEKVAIESNRNLRRALLMVETMKVRGNTKIIQPQWLEFLKKMAKNIIENQTVECLKETRTAYYELQTHLIPPELIFKVIMAEIVGECLDDVMKKKTIELAAHYEHKMRIGSKHIYHFEAFVATFMAVYRKYMEEHVIDDGSDMEFL